MGRGTLLQKMAGPSWTVTMQFPEEMERVISKWSKIIKD